MTVAQRLGLLIGVALLALLAIAGSGLYQMNKVFEKANWANINLVPSIIMLDKTAREFGHLRVLMYRHVLNTDNKKNEAIETDIKTSQAEIEKLLSDYASTGMLTDDHEKTLLVANSAAFKDYESAIPPVLALSQAGKTEDARALLIKNGALAEKMSISLNEQIAYNQVLSTNLSQAASAAKYMGVVISAVIAIVAFAVLIFIGFFITRSLLRQLGGEPVYAAEVVSQVAAGDLTVQVVTKAGDTTSMLAAMKTMVDKLSGIVSEVRSAADGIASASEEVSATAQNISQATNEQAASVEETSASVEQMSASINQNTENSKVTDGIASKAAKDANEGGQAVKQTVMAMKSIAEKISIIDDIAYQTNLLALNAAIEAARAGEHGKGFAVVAAEVRKLAERSQVAAQEIGEVAKNSVGLAEQAGALLDEIVPSINKTSDLVQEISAASEEQSTGAGQINAAISQLSQTTQQNASSSEELAATAEEMSGQAEQLQDLISYFRVDVVGSKAASFAKTKTVTKSKPKRALSGNSFALAGVDIDESQFVKF